MHSAFQALLSIGYKVEQFSDPLLREQWRREKGMLVLKFWSELHRETPLDVFVYDPFPFDEEYDPAIISGHPPARFVALIALLKMKHEAECTKDKLNIENLTFIQDA
ncbi:MAG: hypothetical protein SH807_07700 [Blastochloris sp.]|nr:hypothetical protein [Blastochloris sp.]